MEITTNGPAATYNSSEPSRERSATLWFDDGNVVLQTKTKQYRVHRSVLGSHSSIFRDMFSVPQPEFQETVDGCPAVNVADSAQDWDILLAVMYGNQMVGPKLDVIPFETLRAALVLGTKYDFERYRTSALAMLERLFPQTLSDWDAVNWIREGEYYWDEWIQLLELVLSFGHRTMLPAAYFTCICNGDEGDIVKEYRQNRTRPIPFDSLDQLVFSRGRILCALGDHVLKWCWDGNIPSRDCLDNTRCSKKLFPYFHEVTKDPLGIEGLLDEFGLTRFGSIDLCPICRDIAVKEHNKGRRSAWLQLPIFFGLEDWDSLHE